MVRSIVAGACLAALLPGAAFAQKAAYTNEQKQPYCQGYGFDAIGLGQVILTDLGAGKTRADLFFLYRADPAKAQFPVTGDPVVAIYPGEETINPGIGIWYRFTLGADGQPNSEVLPVSVTATGGDFLDPPGDFDQYRLSLTYGATKVPLVTPKWMFEQMNDLVAGTTSSAEPPQQSYDTIPQADLNRIVQGLESGDRGLVIEKGGTIIATLPVPSRDITAERTKMLGWIQTTLPLLKKGQCPAT